MAYTTINKPNTYFNTVLYTGTGTTTSVTDVNFKPDLSWLKMRSAVEWNFLVDSVRGANKAVWSNATDAEYNYSGDAAQILTTFNTNGFSLGTSAAVNGSGQTFASWNWLGSNTTTNNTAGTISSTVCANTTSGFSIVSYTGTGANATVGHGLGIAPRMIIFKSRNSATSWPVYHASIGATQFGALNATDAWSSSSLPFNNTAPTSSVFSIGTSGGTNSTSMIAYCFADVKGFSKFDSYTGNSSTNGTFVYTGFKPAFVMLKVSNLAGEQWLMLDNKRNTYNVVNGRLFPSLSNAESTAANILDFLSNGFKLRNADSSVNTGYTYIYAAFAENPLVGTNNIPTTAR